MRLSRKIEEGIDVRLIITLGREKPCAKTGQNNENESDNDAGSVIIIDQQVFKTSINFAPHN